MNFVPARVYSSLINSLAHSTNIQQMPVEWKVSLFPYEEYVGTCFLRNHE